MRLALLALFTLLVLWTPQAYGCSGRTVADATAIARTRRSTPAGYSPRSTFSDCFFVHFRPDEKSGYEGAPSDAIREEFLYQYILVAFDAAASVPNTQRAAEYHLYAIGAADAYLELAGTHPAVFNVTRLREVLHRLGDAYFTRRDVDANAMMDLVYQYESIARSTVFGVRCFERRTVDQWERALRCISGNCSAEAQLEAKIRAERAELSPFVQRCTSFAEFLTGACADLRLAVLLPRKQKFDRFLQSQV